MQHLHTKRIVADLSTSTAEKTVSGVPVHPTRPFPFGAPPSRVAAPGSPTHAWHHVREELQVSGGGKAPGDAGWPAGRRPMVTSTHLVPKSPKRAVDLSDSRSALQRSSHWAPPTKIENKNAPRGLVELTVHPPELFQDLILSGTKHPAMYVGLQH